MRINHNIAALNTYRQLNSATNAQSSSMEKLSSGLRINRAGDDAAGLAISEKMRGQIRGLDMASKNAQDATSLIQTAEGALNETHSILQRMRELSVQASNDTNTSDDRAEIQKEINQLTEEVDRIADTTEFNTKTLLKGDYGTTAVSSDTSKVQIKSSITDSVTEGDYTVAVSNAAVQASKTGGADVSSGVTVTEGSNDTLVMNGVTIKFEEGTYTQAQLVNKINEYSDETNVTVSASTDYLKFDHNEYGNKQINIAGNALTAMVGTTTDTAGEDATITVDSKAVTIDLDSEDARRFTITSGSLKGLELSTNGAADGESSTITINKDELVMQIGANKDQSFKMTIQDMSAKSLGVDAIDVTNNASATNAIEVLDNAIQKVSGERSKLGAYQNRLDHTINNLNTSSENLTAAESRVRDVDYALAA